MVRVERVRLADGVPIAFEDAAVLEEYQEVLDADLATGSLHGALERLGIVATSASGTVTARAARRAEAASLDIPTRSALLVEMRLLFDQHGRPFERTETRYVADRYVIDVMHVHPYASRRVGPQRGADGAGVGTQSSGDDLVPLGGHEHAMAGDGATDRLQQIRAGAGDASTDHHALGHEHRDHVGDGDTEVVGHCLDRLHRPLIAGRRSTEHVLDRRLPSQRGERP